LNPGEVSAHKTKIASFAVYDTDNNTWKIVELDQSISIETDLSKNHRDSIDFKFWHMRHHQY
jgi:hypothetical protein